MLSGHCHDYTVDKAITFFTNVVALLIVIVLGLVGNSLVVAVFAVDKKRCSSTVLLQALAVFDNIILLSGLFASVLHSVFPLSGGGHWLYDNKDYMRIVSLPVLMWAKTSSTWCIVLVTIDRYICVSKPLKAAAICTKQRARMMILSLTGAAMAYNIPRFFQYRMGDSRERCSNDSLPHMVKTDMYKHSVFVAFYSISLYCLVMYIIPLALLVTMNFSLIKLLSRARKQRYNMANASNTNQNGSLRLRKFSFEESITLSVICIIAKFIVCISPDLVLQIMYVNDSPNTPMLEVFSNMMIYINAGTNFLLYAVVGRRFRNILLTKLFRTKKEQRRQASINSLETWRKAVGFDCHSRRKSFKLHTTDATINEEVDWAENEKTSLEGQLSTPLVSRQQTDNTPTCGDKIECEEVIKDCQDLITKSHANGVLELTAGQLRLRARQSSRSREASAENKKPESKSSDYNIMRVIRICAVKPVVEETKHSMHKLLI